MRGAGEGGRKEKRKRKRKERGWGKGVKTRMVRGSKNLSERERE